MGGTNDRSIGDFLGSPSEALESLGGAVTLRDYRHASMLFVDGAFRLLPKFGFLYHVAFDFDAHAPFARTESAAKIEAGMLVKEVTLPSFDIESKTMNAYNRKNVVQTKVNYQEVDITFHDDSANITNTLWTEYFKYYYGDSGQPEESYHIPTKYQTRTRQDWGFTAPEFPFFKSIRLYSLAQHKYTAYVLMNPIITGWRHGTHASDSEGMLENRMTISYENILYGHGSIVEAADEPKYFTDLHYDTLTSPLGKGSGAGAPPSIFGAGGAINTVQNVFNDLADGNVLGAAGSAINGYKNFSDIKATLKDEAWNIGRDVMRGNDVGNRFYFDNPVKTLATSVQDGIQGVATGIKTTRAQGNVRAAAAAVTSNNVQIGSTPQLKTLSQIQAEHDLKVTQTESDIRNSGLPDAAQAAAEYRARSDAIDGKAISFAGYSDSKKAALRDIGVKELISNPATRKPNLGI